jgi:hypothetical protein
MVRRLSAGLLSQRPGVNSRPVCVGFVVNKVALGQVFLRVHKFSSVIIHPVRQALSLMCHRRHTLISIDSEINKNEWGYASASPRAYTSFVCFSGSVAQRGLWPPRTTRFLDHTQRRTTVGRNPLDEWSLFAETSTWQHTTDKHPCPGGIRTHDRSRRSAVDLLRACRAQG